MSAPVNSIYRTVTSSARKFRAPIAADLLSRSLANANHVWKRLTGADITGFATNSVTGHGHTGAGDGLPMPRHLASMTSAVPLIGRTVTEDGYAGYLAPGSEPLISLYPGLAALSESRLPDTGLNPISILTIPGTDFSDAIRIAPCFRRVLVPPGCRHVGARLTYHDWGLVDRPAIGFWRARLAAAPSSDVSGDMTGLTGHAFTATTHGETIAFATNPADGGSFVGVGTLSFDASEGLFYAETYPRGLGELWLGRPARRYASGDVASTTVLLDGTPAPNHLYGAVEVSPGVHNDIDIEVFWETPSALFIYSIDLFAIP